MGEESKNGGYAVLLAVFMIGIISLVILYSLSPMMVTEHWDTDPLSFRASLFGKEVPTSLIFNLTRANCTVYEKYSNVTGLSYFVFEIPNITFIIPLPSEELRDFGEMTWKEGKTAILSSSTLREGRYVLEAGHYIEVQIVGMKTPSDVTFKLLVIDSVRQATPLDDYVSQHNYAIRPALAVFQVASVTLIAVPSIEILSSIWERLSLLLE